MNNIPRVALCLSGQPRSFAEAYPYIKKNIIDCNPNVDVFIHCWFDEKTVGGQYSGSQTISDDRRAFVQADTIQQITDLYNPVTIVTEPQEDFSRRVRPEYLSGAQSTKPDVAFSMWTSITRSDQLRQEYETRNGFTYDYVIRCRFDSAPLRKIKAHTYNPELLHVSGKNLDTARIPDIIFLSSSKIMTVATSLIDSIEDYFQPHHWTNESIFSQHLGRHGIRIQAHMWHPILIRNESAWGGIVRYIYSLVRGKVIRVAKKLTQ